MSRSKRPKGSAVPSASRRRVQATEGERSAQRQQAAGASDRRGAQCPAPAGGGYKTNLDFLNNA